MSKNIKNKSESIKLKKEYSNNLIINERPVFSFYFQCKNLHIEKLDKDKQSDLLVRLSKLSELSWYQIDCSDRHKFGYEKIDKKSLNFSLPLHVTDETTIIAFRSSGLLSMVGYRDTNTFHILAVDQNFNSSCYKH